jgi:hypothetical protein
MRTITAVERKARNRAIRKKRNKEADQLWIDFKFCKTVSEKRELISKYNPLLYIFTEKT